MANRTLGELKLLASNVWCATSTTLASLGGTSPSTVTTKELLKVGRMAEVTTTPSTKYSNVSTHSSVLSTLTSHSTHSTSQAAPTLLMAPPEAHTPPPVIIFHPSAYLSSWMTSSLTHSSLPLPQSCDSSKKDTTPMMSPNASSTLTGLLRQACNLALASPAVNVPAISPSTTRPSAHFNSHLPNPSRVGEPWPYHSGLKQAPSDLHPHCMARECLWLWCPPSPWSGMSLSLMDADLDQILSVINISWAQGTHKAYGAGLLVFHTFCEMHNIPDRLL